MDFQNQQKKKKQIEPTQRQKDIQQYEKMILQKQQKFIVVCGGVASGIGKGITIASMASLLKNSGQSVSLIKVDPYLNKDAGLMSPFEHGEVYILSDGGEVDLDLGNYERFLGVNFTSSHNITSGKIYAKVMEKERKGYYKGQIVKFQPHAIQEIKHQILKTSLIPVDGSDYPPSVILIELGGTVGDLESVFFLESIRQLQLDYGKENICIVLVSYALKTNDSKYKEQPIQNSIKSLNNAGLIPDLIMIRSEKYVDEDFKIDIAKYANILSYQVINIPNLKFQFEVCLELHKQLAIPIIAKRLQLPIVETDIFYYSQMTRYCEEIILNKEKIKIALVGKYVSQPTDNYFSILKAFEAASFEVGCGFIVVEVDPKYLDKEAYFNTECGQKEYDKLNKYNWEELRTCDGIYIAGGYGFSGFEGKILAAQYARENNIPCYGVCFGFQAMAVEFARNVIGIKDAQSEEFKTNYKSNNFVVKVLPDTSLTKLGGTMRLGNKKTHINDTNSLAYKIFGEKEITERHRHRYEFNDIYLEQYESHGYKFPGYQDSTPKRYSISEYTKNYFHVGTQFHPEFGQSYAKPSKIYCAFLAAIQGTFEENVKKNGIFKIYGLNKVVSEIEQLDFQNNIKKLTKLEKSKMSDEQAMLLKIIQENQDLLKYNDFEDSDNKVQKLDDLNPINCNYQQSRIQSYILSHPTQIFNWLYIGSRSNALDQEDLIKVRNIKYILNCTKEIQNFFEEDKIFEYEKIPLESKDVEIGQNITKYLNKIVEFINKAKQNDQNILIHCNNGNNRSAAILIAYLIINEKYSLKEAAEIVYSQRPSVQIKCEYVEELLEIEKETNHLQQNSCTGEYLNSNFDEYMEKIRQQQKNKKINEQNETMQNEIIKNENNDKITDQDEIKINKTEPKQAIEKEYFEEEEEKIRENNGDSEKK